MIQIQSIKRLFKNAFKGEDDSFVLLTALKLIGISFLILLFIYLIFYNHMKINSFYLQSIMSNSGALETYYYDYLTRNVYQTLPYVFTFFVFMFFAGIYIAKSLLRPFDLIADYTEQASLGREVDYDNNSFSSQRLLTNFSEYFFNYIRICQTDKKLRTNLLPPQYTKIHAPVFDKIFFFHFSLILGIVCILTSWFVYAIATDIQANLVELFLQTTKTKGIGVTSFLVSQSEIFDLYINIGIGITIIFYIILGFHLYSKVSSAAFGYFATMRSFMKGNFFARIHLIGYEYIRPQSRKVNKFLDHLQKTLEAEE